MTSIPLPARPRPRPTHPRAGAEDERSTKPTLRIGELAAVSDVTVETLRYYEARGLLAPSRRRASGYREFPAGAVNEVRFIRRAQALGFSLAEVSELVRLRTRAWEGSATAELREAVVAKLEGIDAQMRDLRRLRAELAGLVAACDASCAPEQVSSGDATSPRTRATTDCPLVDALDSDAISTVPRGSVFKGHSARPSKPGHRTRSQDSVPVQPVPHSTRRSR